MNGGPPDNAAYLHAAYALVLFVYGGYAAVLLRRRARVRRVLDRLAPDRVAPDRIAPDRIAPDRPGARGV